jgi:DNA invertase Pin-like site-specific DNA recombinase
VLLRLLGSRHVHPYRSHGVQIGYARVSTGHQSLDQQLDALTAAGVNPDRIYRDKLPGTSTREQRPGLATLLDDARSGDAIVVVEIDRLGRNAAEVMTTIRELRDREIVLRSLREGIDTSNATGVRHDLDGGYRFTLSGAAFAGASAQRGHDRHSSGIR